MSAGDDDGRAIPFIAWEKDEFRVTDEAREFLSKVRQLLLHSPAVAMLRSQEGNRHSFPCMGHGLVSF